MDRFMMKVYVDYPDMKAEKKILTLASNPLRDLSPIMGTDDLLEMKENVGKVYVG